MRTPALTIRPYKSHRFVLDLRPLGQGRKFFKSRDDARTARQRALALLYRQGEQAINLPPRDLAEFIRAREKLAPYARTITEAADFLIHHEKNIRRCNVTVAQLASEVIEAKRMDGRSQLYLIDLTKRLARFSESFGGRLIASLTVEELDNWLRALPLSPKSRMNYRANVGVLFAYAKQRRMIAENPIEFTAKPTLVDSPPEIFTVDELRSLLESAHKTEADIVPMLAIGAFAGLRTEEIKKLHWSEVDLVRGYVEVKAAKAKSARRRLVPIQPNLAAWLKPYSGLTGSVVPLGTRGKLGRACKLAGLTKWPNNGLRHSFASYRLAACHDAPRVSGELGHSSPQMLWANYRELVRPEEAESYWRIMPATEAANVVAFDGICGTVCEK